MCTLLKMIKSYCSVDGAHKTLKFFMCGDCYHEDFCNLVGASQRLTAAVVELIEACTQ